MSKKILLAVDGSKGSVKATKEAIALAKQLEDVSITALYVVSKRAAQNEIIHCLDKAHIESSRKKRLEPVDEILKESGLTYEMKIQVGDPGRTVGDIADAGNYDWVFVGSRGHNKLQKMVLGSVSESIIEHVQAPVFVIK